MSSIFIKDDNHVDKPKRNTFDLSCQNNLTLKMGKIIPVLCKEVLPGDSFQIKPSFGLRYMPQVFPVQTRQRASIKYYYVRNRNLWKDWMDFIGKTKEGLTPPYLDFTNANSYYLRPSSIADYMGVPVKVYPSKTGNNEYKLRKPDLYGTGDYVYVPQGNLLNNEVDPFSIFVTKNIESVYYYLRSIGNPQEANTFKLSDFYGGREGSILPPPTFAKVTVSQDQFGVSEGNPYLFFFRTPMRLVEDVNLYNVVSDTVYTAAIFRLKDGTDIVRQFGNQGIITIPKSGSTIVYKSCDVDDNGNFSLVPKSGVVDSFVGLFSPTPINFEDIGWNQWETKAKVDARDNDLYWCDVADVDLPYYNSSNPDGLRVSAIPFRAVQSVYNCCIRNAENNPFILNGVPEYNKYIVSDEGGAVSVFTEKTLEDYFANWSDDRFTTSLPSPQQGNAPLVGLTGVRGATLEVSADDGTTSTLHLQVNQGTGNVVFVDAENSDTPSEFNDLMMSAVEYGITINDLRNVNAFQKWLENNIRRGYKYKDQLMAHFGVKAKFDVLDMPEFIGGVTRDVNVQQITSTAATEDASLGEYAGQSYIMGEGHSIEHYCDEHGFIIGLMTVTPVPMYMDTLPKHLIKQDAFDYYFSEFGKIGPQPITKKEISFSQSLAEGEGDKTFGYQRAWYDYLESLDEVHGLFRDDLRNFLIARDFAATPSLGSDFLTVNPEDVNNTFYSNDLNDKIIGQIYHNISVKRGIPLYGIPSIE